VIALASALHTADTTIRGAQEYQIKAAFLLNFTRFVEWPDTAFAAPESPILIGIVGEDPFGGALEDAVRNQTVKDRPLVVARVPDTGPYDGFHLLFVCPSESDRSDKIIAQAKGLGMLTVSDVDGFAKKGGIIRFYLLKNKIRFEINPEAAKLQGLKLRSQLLSLGTIVHSDPKSETP
jgi:hypothetical protein